MSLVDEVPARVLAVYAHPDDADVSCGGTLAAWSAAGSSIEVLVCAAGDKGSSDPSADPSALAQRRAEEVAAAARALGVGAHSLLGRPDGELSNDADLRRSIVEVVRRFQPDAVVCPDPTAALFGASYVNHRDHREVAWAALDAVAHEAPNPHYFPDAGPSHRTALVFLSGTLQPDTWVDISGAIEAKALALLHHQSQVGETAEWLRMVVRERAEDAGRQAGVALAEGFRVLRLS